MTLISIFGKDVEEARKALKSKIVLSLVLACVFFGERAVGHVADGLRYGQSWISTLLNGETWTPDPITARFMEEKHKEYTTYVASDRAFWLDSDLAAAPWPLAQDVMAAPSEIEGDKTAIREQFKKNTLAGCVCWSESGLRGQMGASAWVTTALAIVEGEQRDAALDDILNKQNASGYWAMFAGVPDNTQNASTYATTVALMAILVHRDSGFLEGDRRIKADRAIENASRWLVRTYNYTEKGWMDYPNSNEGRTLSLGLTAQTVWTLHKSLPTGQLARIDKTFLERDDLAPKMKDFDISDVAVYFDKRTLDYDNTRYARHPWTLLALREGYPNYSNKERVRMRVLLAKALNEKVWNDREQEREYMLLELLFAYQQLSQGPNANLSVASAAPAR